MEHAQTCGFAKMLSILIQFTPIIYPSNAAKVAKKSKYQSADWTNIKNRNGKCYVQSLLLFGKHVKKKKTVKQESD